jgi:hypothetical protein
MPEAVSVETALHPLLPGKQVLVQTPDPVQILALLVLVRVLAPVQQLPLVLVRVLAWAPVRLPLVLVQVLGELLHRDLPQGPAALYPARSADKVVPLLQMSIRVQQAYPGTVMQVRG